MIVALDAMGGDHAPQVPVQGALEALDEFGSDLRLVLVGPDTEIRRELTACGRDREPRIEIVRATDVITMQDKPAKAIREKPDSSLMKAIRLHKDGRAQAVVSAGHTGAQMAASYLILGLIEGVRRPTIGGLIPIGNGRYSILVDVGANTDCKPINLLQFGIMGAVFIELFAGVKNPRVGLLSIGEEKTKGNELVVASHYLLEQSGLNFLGNVEGGDIFKGKADVIVCDGFVGNIMLKFAESLGPMIFGRLYGPNGSRTEIPERLQQLQREFDAAEIGGVPLLGVNGISIICHGNSRAKAIKNAIREAMTLARGNLPQALSAGVEKYKAGVIARSMALFKSMHEKRDELDVEDEEKD
jgi:glycerol-3-phosphate acyltransferase PlsX